MNPRRLESATILSMVTWSSGIAAGSLGAGRVVGPFAAVAWHSYTPSAMPIYEYRCENGHTFEVIQKMTEEPVATCEVCVAPVQRVLHPVAVHFKGKGFYNTDYGTKRRARELERSAKEGSDKSSSGSASSDGASSSSSSSSSSSDSKPAPAKSDAA